MAMASRDWRLKLERGVAQSGAAAQCSAVLSTQPPAAGLQNLGLHMDPTKELRRATAAIRRHLLRLPRSICAALCAKHAALLNVLAPTCSRQGSRARL